jgi:hypothetical protein
MSEHTAAVIEIELTGVDCFVRFNGVRIAKRGNHRNWIALLPGYRVTSPPDHSTISVEVLPDLGQRRRHRQRDQQLRRGRRNPAT